MFISKIFFKYSNYFLYADDLKLCHVLNSVGDAIYMRPDLDSPSSRCQRTYLDLNINKCRTISFYRMRSPIIFDYI